MAGELATSAWAAARAGRNQALRTGARRATVRERWRCRPAGLPDAMRLGSSRLNRCRVVTRNAGGSRK